MSYKIKYSSLLFLKKKNSILYLKGPLGKNYLKVPYNVGLYIDTSKKIIIFYPIKCFNKKKKNLLGFLSIFKNSCQTLVFGDLTSLNIKGLGLKFLEIIPISLKKKYLSMSLGYADSVNFIIDNNRIIVFFQDIRNVWIYSTDYAYLRNKVLILISLKIPNKFQKRENGITLSRKIV